MIDNFKKGINNSISKIGNSVYKEGIQINTSQAEANALLQALKQKHQGTIITSAEVAVYKQKYDRLVNNYNRIYRVVNSARQRLKTIDRVVASLNTTVNVLSVIVTTLQLLPAPAQFTLLGIIMVLSNRLNSASSTISEIKKFLNSVTVVLQSILDRYNKLLSDLVALNSTLQEILVLLTTKSTDFKSANALEDSSTLEGFFNDFLTNDLGVYKEFKFVLRIEDDPQFNIGEIRIRYAVAIKDGKDVYFSDRSYTLNPEILIDQLKLQIDQ